MPPTEDEDQDGPEEGAGEGGAEETAARPTGFAAGMDTTQPIFVETGRGEAVQVTVGDPFFANVTEIADRANYGGYFRVFLNGEEIVDPEEAPDTIDAGMRIAITSYDKVGLL